MTVDPRLPPDEGDDWRELKRRVSAIERAQRLKTSSIRAGSIQILDADSQPVGRIGELETSVPVDSGLIINVEDASGPLDAHLLVSGRSGIELPWLAHPWVPVAPGDVPVVIVASGFPSVFHAMPRMVTGPQIDFVVVIGLTGGATGQARVMESKSDGSPAMQVGVDKAITGSGGAYYFTANVHSAIGDGRTVFTLQVGRTNGVGTVTVAWPYELSMGKWFPGVSANGWQ
jgi:hypothetical protein